ncbi:hypothetical protein M9Y10_002422 [Tritrichomonas musculus]|uniref:Protein kinase domain-containing protein n=1 Tax=Tritrichomonas musculus TaxID=1915356 RepID=A0ABR2L9R1_9EUKA
MEKEEENGPQENSKGNPSVIVDEFEILEQIGAGAFSHVHIAKHIPTGCYCAAKIIDLPHLKEDEFIGIMREVSVFMQVDHPNICNLYRLSITDDKLIFFMEYASRGTLLEYVNAKGGLTEFEAQRYFIQIFSALRHLHMYHFLVHRDLKLENILIDSKGNMKVTDFGLAGTYYNNIMRTFVGTAGYQPPEILAGNEYNEKCDVWSLGVCLYAMVSGSLPFSTQNASYRALVQEAEEMTFPKFSPGLIDLLKKMFAIRPNERPSLIQLQNHPWLRGVQILGTNIAPQPVMFYKVPSVSVIKKFQRRSLKPDQKVLEMCAEKGINTEELTNMLKNGQTTSQTTIYFCLLHPLFQKPEKPKPKPKPKPMQPPAPIIPGSRTRKTTTASMPPSKDIQTIKRSGPRKGSVPIFSQTSKTIPVNISHKAQMRASSNKSNPIINPVNKLIKKPITPTLKKRPL